MPYKEVTFKEFAPKNFLNFRILYNEQYSYNVSFINTFKNGGFIQDHGSNVLYSGDRKYLIQHLDIADINALLPMVNTYFYHFCKYPNSLLPAICGLYSLELTTKVHYYMVVSNYFPGKREGSTNTYFINSVVKKNEIFESNSSEQLKEKDFEETFPRGLGLPLAINMEFINTLNKDLSFLTEFGILKYGLVIFTDVRKVPNNDGVCLLCKGDVQIYKKGVIVKHNENQLNTYITIGIFDFIIEHTSLVQDNVVNDSPVDTKKQYMEYIKKYAIFYKYF